MAFCSASFIFLIASGEAWKGLFDHFQRVVRGSADSVGDE